MGPLLTTTVNQALLAARGQGAVSIECSLDLERTRATVAIGTTHWRWQGVDFPYLLTMIHDSFMSRPNCIVVPGGKMEMAIRLVVTPLLQSIMERRKSAKQADGQY